MSGYFVISKKQFHKHLVGSAVELEHRVDHEALPGATSSRLDLATSRTYEAAAAASRRSKAAELLLRWRGGDLHDLRSAARCAPRPRSMRGAKHLLLGLVRRRGHAAEPRGARRSAEG